MPAWINRLANMGSIFHCVVPRRYLNKQPSEGNEQADESDVISNANQSTRASSYALLCNENILEWTVASNRSRHSSHQTSDFSTATTMGTNNSRDSDGRVNCIGDSSRVDLSFPSGSNQS